MRSSGFHRFLVAAESTLPLPRMEEDGAQIHQRSHTARIQFQRPLIGSDCFVSFETRLFQLQPALEPVGSFGNAFLFARLLALLLLFRGKGQQAAEVHGIEVEQKLAAFGVQNYLYPQKRQFLQYTTTSPVMHQRLGVGEAG